MNLDAASPAPVGQQLADRRNDLDLTQEALAQQVGVSARTISAVERGVNEIQRRNRPAFEKALRLKAGTISRAYMTGGMVEPLDARAEPDDEEIGPAHAMIDEIERNPKLQRRLRKILSAGSGHAGKPDDSDTPDTERDSGDGVAG